MQLPCDNPASSKAAGDPNSNPNSMKRRSEFEPKFDETEEGSMLSFSIIFHTRWRLIHENQNTARAVLRGLGHKVFKLEIFTSFIGFL